MRVVVILSSVFIAAALGRYVSGSSRGRASGCRRRRQRLAPRLGRWFRERPRCARSGYPPRLIWSPSPPPTIARANAGTHFERTRTVAAKCFRSRRGASGPSRGPPPPACLPSRAARCSLAPHEVHTLPSAASSRRAGQRPSERGETGWTLSAWPTVSLLLRNRRGDGTRCVPPSGSAQAATPARAAKHPPTRPPQAKQPWPARLSAASGQALEGWTRPPRAPPATLRLASRQRQCPMMALQRSAAAQ